MSGHTSDIVKGIVNSIEMCLGKAPFAYSLEQDYNRYADYVAELYKEYDTKGRQFVLILDGLERLLPTKERDNLKFLPVPNYDLQNLQHFSCVIATDGIHVPLMHPNQRDEWDGDWSASKIYNLHNYINGTEKIFAPLFLFLAGV